MPTLAELAALLGGTLDGPPDLTVNGVGAVDRAGPGELTFITDARHLPGLKSSRAAAVLLPLGADAGGLPAVRVANPGQVLPLLLRRFAPVPPPVAAERIDPSARIHSTARVAADARIGAYAVIDAGVEIGAGSDIGALCAIGWGARLGAGCRLMPLVVVGERCVLGDRVLVHSGAVLGADGFGFLPASGGEVPMKVPQIGRVVVEDDVEIGANCTVDRATLGETTLRRGVKLDDQVHIAHNCEIGAGTVIAGQTGVSGSVTIGRGCRIGGQVGIADHLVIGDGASIGAQSGLHKDVPAGGMVFGSPARPGREAFKLNAEVARLPKLLARVRELERRLADLERKGQRAA